jgi:hypothetical protein
MHPAFSIGEAVRFGWSVVRAHSGLVFKVMLTLFVLQMANGLLDNDAIQTVPGGLLSFALTVVGFFVSTGFLLIMLGLAKGETPVYRALYPNWRVVLKLFGASLLVGLIVLLPLLGVALAIGVAALFEQAAGYIAAGALVLAAMAALVYLAVTYSLVRFAVLDGMRVMESLKASARYTKGVKWKLLGFGVVLALINLLGLLAFIVGLLVTVPLTTIAAAKVYLTLKARHA